MLKLEQLDSAWQESVWYPHTPEIQTEETLWGGGGEDQKG